MYDNDATEKYRKEKAKAETSVAQIRSGLDRSSNASNCGSSRTSAFSYVCGQGGRVGTYRCGGVNVLAKFGSTLNSMDVASFLPSFSRTPHDSHFQNLVFHNLQRETLTPDDTIVGCFLSLGRSEQDETGRNEDEDQSLRLRGVRLPALLRQLNRPEWECLHFLKSY